MVLSFFNVGPFEIIILLVVGLLIFGRRLPEVGKNLGKGIVEFKKGLHGIEDEVNSAGTPAASAPKPPAQLPPVTNVSEIDQLKQSNDQLREQLNSIQRQLAEQKKNA